MDRKELKKAEKRVNLLYALYDSEDDAAEKQYIRNQITKLCISIYGTPDAPERMHVFVGSRQAEIKITIDELIKRLNSGEQLKAIAEEVGISHQGLHHVKNSHIEWVYELNEFMYDLLEGMNNGASQKELCEKYEINKTHMSALVSLGLKRIYSAKDTEGKKYKSKYIRE